MILLLLIIRKRVIFILRRTASNLASPPRLLPGLSFPRVRSIIAMLGFVKWAASKSRKIQKAPYLKKTGCNPEFSAAHETTPLESKNVSKTRESGLPVL